MVEIEETNKLPTWRRFLYVIAPLLFLLTCLATINLTPRFVSTALVTATPALDTITRTAVSPTLPPPTLTPIPTFTQTPTPAPTALPAPTLPPTAALIPLAPPPDATFPSGAEITLVWQWPEPLTNGQQLVVALQADNETVLLAAPEKPNLGLNYQLSLKTAEIFPTAQQMSWTVQLRDENDRLLLAAPTRLLNLTP